MFLLSFLVSSFYVPQISGTETNKLSENTINFPKTARFLCLDNYILQKLITGDDFVRIIISVSDIVKHNQKYGDSCSYISSQTIKICDYSDKINLAVDSPPKSSRYHTTNFAAVSRIIKMIEHYFGVNQLPNNYRKEFPLCDKTFGIFKTSEGEVCEEIKKLLEKITYDSKKSSHVWRSTHIPVSVAALEIALEELLSSING